MAGAPPPWLVSAWGSEWSAGAGRPTGPWSGFPPGFASPTATSTSASSSGASASGKASAGSSSSGSGSASSTPAPTSPTPTSSSSASSTSQITSSTAGVQSNTSAIAAASHSNHHLTTIVLPAAIVGAFVAGLIVTAVLLRKRLFRRRAGAFGDGAGTATEDTESVDPFFAARPGLGPPSTSSRQPSGSSNASTVIDISEDRRPVSCVSASHVAYYSPTGTGPHPTSPLPPMTDKLRREMRAAPTATPALPPLTIPPTQDGPETGTTVPYAPMTSRVSVARFEVDGGVRLAGEGLRQGRAASLPMEASGSREEILPPPYAEYV